MLHLCRCIRVQKLINTAAFVLSINAKPHANYPLHCTQQLLPGPAKVCIKQQLCCEARASVGWPLLYRCIYPFTTVVVTTCRIAEVRHSAAMNTFITNALVLPSWEKSRTTLGISRQLARIAFPLLLLRILTIRTSRSWLRPRDCDTRGGVWATTWAWFTFCQRSKRTNDPQTLTPSTIQ